MNSKLVSIVAALLVALGAVASVGGGPVTGLFDMMGHHHDCLDVFIYWPARGAVDVDFLTAKERRDANREYSRKQRECKQCCKRNGWAHSKLVREDDPELRVCDCGSEPITEYAFGMVPHYGRRR